MASLEIKYVGMQDEVIVPDLDRAVKRGEVVELEGDYVAVGKSLLEQSDIWAKVEHKKTPESGSKDTSA